MSLHAGGYSKFTWSDGPLYISDLPSDKLGARYKPAHSGALNTARGIP
jgi:hypothetical protein